MTLVPSERLPELQDAIDLYEVLCLEKKEIWAFPAEEQRKRIRAAYFALMRLYHPDRVARLPQADKVSLSHALHTGLLPSNRKLIGHTASCLSR